MKQVIKEKFDSYPKEANIRLNKIRSLIFETAEELGLDGVTEELKWGEPSYTCKKGSPIRIDWKPVYPEQISLFVNCKTILIETYKEVYGGQLKYMGNREVVLPFSEPLPIVEIKGCIAMALQYHKLKKLPLLGA